MPWCESASVAQRFSTMRPRSTLWEKPTIAHVSIGVRDIDRSERFYEAALEPLGHKCLRAARTLLGYGYARDSIALWVVQHIVCYSNIENQRYNIFRLCPVNCIPHRDYLFYRFSIILPACLWGFNRMTAVDLRSIP